MAETGPQQRITIRGGDPPFFQCIYAYICSGSQRPLFCDDATNACAVPLGYPGMLSRAREVLGCREGASGVARYILYTVTAQLASFADNSAAASPRPPGAGGQLTSTEERVSEQLPRHDFAARSSALESPTPQPALSATPENLSALLISDIPTHPIIDVASPDPSSCSDLW